VVVAAAVSGSLNIPRRTARSVRSPSRARVGVKCTRKSCLGKAISSKWRV
jgi:hypothetical protein